MKKLYLAAALALAVQANKQLIIKDDPVEPVDPVDPEDPVDPVDPIEPDVPVEPNY